VREVLGWSAEIVRHPPKIAPEGVMRAWVREFDNEGIAIDSDKFVPEKGPNRPFLPKRRIVADLRLALSQRTGGLAYGLRAAAGERRSLHLRGHESSLMARRLARS
jgi:hypothetical protein